MPGGDDDVNLGGDEFLQPSEVSGGCSLVAASSWANGTHQRLASGSQRTLFPANGIGLKSSLFRIVASVALRRGDGELRAVSKCTPASCRRGRAGCLR